MTKSISAQKISDLIGLIYDCAIDPAGWSSVLDAVMADFDFAHGGLVLQMLPSGQQLLNVSSGVDPYWQARQPDYALDALNLWGGPSRVGQFPLDEPILHSKIEGLPAIEANRYYSEWLAPQGMYDAVAFIVARDPGLLGSIAWSRHKDFGEVDDFTMQHLRLIAPHFRRATSISRLLDVKSIAAAGFATTLDSFSTGVVLVDAALAIVHVNSAAAAMLASGSPIRSRGGKLSALNPKTTAAIEAVVAQAATEEQNLGQRGIGIALRNFDGSPSVMHVLPMGRGDLRPGLQPKAKVALFIASAQTPPQMPREALALIYDMTPAESRVFELIIEGKTPGEIAVMLGVAPSTVKTHLLHVFDKTGSSRQADLVKLASSLSMPI